MVTALVKNPFRKVSEIKHWEKDRRDFALEISQNARVSLRTSFQHQRLLQDKKNVSLKR